MIFEFAGYALDILVTLILIFWANRILWWTVGRRININIKIIKRKPETVINKYD